MYIRTMWMYIPLSKKNVDVCSVYTCIILVSWWIRVNFCTRCILVHVYVVAYILSRVFISVKNAHVQMEKKHMSKCIIRLV
jgi:hypothetical protein